MSGFVPRFKLWNSAGDTLLHTFEIVQRTNAPQSPRKIVEIEGQRGIGSIIVDGGVAPWNLIIEGVLAGSTGDDYEELTQKIDAMESAVEVNTPYILTIDKTASTYYQYRVKRIEPIDYPTSLRINLQRYRITFRVNSW